MIKKRKKVGRQRVNDENDNWNGVFKKIILAVVVALLAGGSAPWWWNEFIKAKVGPEVVGPTPTKTDNPTPTVTNTPPIPTITSIPTSVGTPENTLPIPEISISSVVWKPDSPTYYAGSPSDSSLDFNFGRMGPGMIRSDKFSISNKGYAWSVSTDRPWLTVNPTSGVNSGLITFSVNTIGLDSNSYTGTITITSKGGTRNARVRFEIFTGNRFSLGVGDIWDIGNGWSIKANAIDARSNPRQVWITLYRYGNQLDDPILENRQLDYGGWSNATYNYNNIFSTEASIYSGTYSYDVLFTNTSYQ